MDLHQLIEAFDDCVKFRARRDACGDLFIQGSCGNIHAIDLLFNFHLRGHDLGVLPEKLRVHGVSPRMA